MGRSLSCNFMACRTKSIRGYTRRPPCSFNTWITCPATAIGSSHWPTWPRFSTRTPGHPMALKIHLRRWMDRASRGCLGGHTHAHRKPAELPNVMLAEDLNAAFPIVYWTTDADVPPNRSNRNFKGDFPAAPVEVDATH